MKSTVFATTYFLLRTVRDSADAFPPLKSVAGGLCSILENFEVWFVPYVLLLLRCLEAFQRAQENKQAIELLALRIESLDKLLKKPVPKDDADEESRREKLQR
jgi:hypothetical protein